MSANALTVTQATGWSVSGTVSIGAVSGTVQVSGPVQVSGTVTAGGVSGTVQVSGAVSPDVAQSPVVIYISNTVAVPTDATLMMTVYTGGTVATAGASFWVVPVGKTFRIQAMYVAAKTSAVLGQANLAVLLGTAAASLSVTSTVGIAAALPYAFQTLVTPFTIGGFKNDVVAGTSIAIGVMSGGTSHTINGAVIQGYLF